MPFAYSLPTLPFRQGGDAGLDAVLGAIAGLGVAHVDLWHVRMRAWCDHLADGERAVAAALARHGLRLSAISAYGEPVPRLIELMATAARLGARTLVTWNVFLADEPDATVASFADRIAPAVRAAERLGVRLAIENHPGAVIDSIASMVELRRLLPSPGLGVALAPNHVHNRGESPADAVRALGDGVALCYAWDTGPSFLADWLDPAEQFAGAGRVDFPALLAALRAVGHGEPLEAFAHGVERWPTARVADAFARALAHLRACEARAGRSTAAG